MIKRGSMMLGLLIVTSSMLVAQEPAERRSATAEQRIAAALDQAIAAGIPARALENRIAEGRAKGVAEERIAAAAEKRLDALLRAQAIVGGGGRDAELTAAALALEAGVGPELVAHIHNVAPEDRRTLALVVLGNLVDQGVASEVALEQVELALRGEAGALQRLNAGGGRPAGMGGGMGADAAAAARARAGGIDAAAAARARARGHVRPGGGI